MKKKVKDRQETGDRQKVVGVADCAGFASLPKCPHVKNNTPLLKTASRSVSAPDGSYSDTVHSSDTVLLIVPFTSCGVSDMSSLFL